MRHGRKQKILLIALEEVGVGSSALLAAEALSRHPNLEVHCIYDEGMTQSALQRARLEKIPGVGVKTRAKKHLPLAYFKIIFYCLKFRPDVVHDLGGSAYRKNLPLWPFLSLMSRLVLSEYAPAKTRPRLFSNRFARNVAYRLAEKFVVFGPQSHAALLHCGVDGRKIFRSRLGHKGFYGEAIREQPRRDPNTVLFFGQFRPGKGIEHLLPVADAVHARCPAAVFWVAGSSRVVRHCENSWAEKLRALLAEMRARPYFKIRDEFISDQDVAEHFLRAGMVLLPYHEANQSGILLTAMPLECPVVATAVGDIPSVIRHGENGILCPTHPGALAEAIVSLLQNPRHAARLAAQARRDAENNFSWEKIVEEYPEKVYGL